jgi:uncharacterized protein YihD (DUF1040 family)
MRDPNRIPDVLEALRVYWEANPDLRLGQIIGNTAARAGLGDGYAMEDDVLMARLGA